MFETRMLRLESGGWTLNDPEGFSLTASGRLPDLPMHALTATSRRARELSPGARRILSILAVADGPVQPDILFINAQRSEIVKETFIEGAPDLVIEVLSPGNWLDDRRTKFRIYALAGVREYWIVDVDRRQIEVFELQDQDYAQVGRYGTGEQVASTVVQGFSIDVDEVCPD
jgi:Uma2 family endonuclease